MRVGIDLDGVCYDFGRALWDWSNGWRETPTPFVEPQRWEFYEDWGLSLEQFIQQCDDAVEYGDLFRKGDPHPNVQEAFARLHTAGHHIHIVTDRSFGQPGASQAATCQWLAEHGLEYDAITFTADKTSVNLDVMVDDKLQNYDALDAAGVEVYLLTRPWNKEHDQRRRVLDLLHYVEVIAA